ncbi:hypothetical protein SRHO_G00186400 [Serrasalmus rhombeus]
MKQAEPRGNGGSSERQATIVCQFVDTSMLNMTKWFKSYKTVPPAAPLPELDTPWRPVEWSEDNKTKMLRKLKEFQLSTPDINQLRILLHGPIGAGKSSFINSVNTVLQGRNTTAALANSAADVESHSFTVKFKYHRLKKDGPGSFYPFVFTDIMGLEQSMGVCTDGIKNILDGHIKNGYTFNPVGPIEKDNQYYNSSPSLKDRVHCLVSVLTKSPSPLTKWSPRWRFDKRHVAWEFPKSPS